MTMRLWAVRRIGRSTKSLFSGRKKGAIQRTKSNAILVQPHPEGYRKALRLMKLADKFGSPIISLIDTAGAYPGIMRRNGISRRRLPWNLREMIMLEVPIIAAVIGEGGSKARWGLAWQIVCVGFGKMLIIRSSARKAAWLFCGKTGRRLPKPSAALRITAKELLELGLVDEIVLEPLGRRL